MRTALYGLCDPTTGELRYLGKTKRPPWMRLTQHMTEARRNKRKTYKNNWIRSLLAVGLKPVMEIYDTVDGDGDHLEIAAIGIARSLGCRLTNAQAGGSYTGAPIKSHWEKIHAQLDARKPRAKLRRALEALR